MAVPLLWRIAFAVRPETAEALADALEPFCVSVSWYEVTAKDWRVEGIAAAEPDRGAVVNALGQAAWRVGIYDGDSFDSPAGDAGKTRHGLHYRVPGLQLLFRQGKLGRFNIGDNYVHPYSTQGFGQVKADAARASCSR